MVQPSEDAGGNAGEERTKRSLIVRILGSLILLGFSLSLAFVFAEVAVRIVAPQQLIVIRPDIWLPVDTLGWMHQPGLDTEINTGERPATLMTDDRGFRVGPASPDEAPTEVLLIGDSFMAALQVDHEESLAGRMEEGLAAGLRHPVAVRNAGVGGWDPPQYLLQGRRLLNSDSYDLMVVSVYVGNDIVSRRVDAYPAVQPVSVAHLRFPRELSVGEFIDAVLRPINDGLETRSHLFTLLRSRLEVLRMKLGLTAAYFPDGFRRGEADEPKWDVTMDILGDLAAEADRHGVPTLFLILPADFQVDAEVFQRHVEGFGLDAADVDLRQPNRILVEGLRARGLDVIDALPALQAAFEEGVRSYGHIDTHFNPDGHRVVWEASRSRMLELLRDARPVESDASGGQTSPGTP